MYTFIIFFLGINVGGSNIIKMKDLKGSLEEAGFQDVQTYIQSGNVVLRSSEGNPQQVFKKITSVVKKDFAIEPGILVLDKKSLTAAVKNNPFKEGEGKTIHFFFLGSKPERPDLQEVEKVRNASEKYKLKEEVFYLFAPDGIGRSKLVAKVEKCMGVTTTARNLNTVNKVLQMAGN